jgi:hypothetical protein
MQARGKGMKNENKQGCNGHDKRMWVKARERERKTKRKMCKWGNVPDSQVEMNIGLHVNEEALKPFLLSRSMCTIWLI